MSEILTMPSPGHRPVEGLEPTTPQSAAGMRMKPTVSDPMPAGARPAAMALAVPPLKPPAMRSGASGLRYGPKTPL